MILFLHLNNVALSGIYFVEKKINMIMDGFFSKLYYSDDCMTMNGLFIEIPIIALTTLFQPKNVLQFDSIKNKDWIYKLSLIEKQIIQYYMFFFGISNKNPLYSLKQQLQNGSIKYYAPLCRDRHEDKSIVYYIKISGIWETATDIGITYKIISC